MQSWRGELPGPSVDHYKLLVIKDYVNFKMVKMEQNMKQNNGFSGIYESAHFANILIEFENDTREMAVDVPESFVAQTKTPPKYPPPSSLGDREEARSSGSSFSALSLSNGHSLNRKSSPLPPNR